MPKLGPVESFGHAEHVAQFLLHEAFRYIHDAAAYEVAGKIFGEKLEDIEVSDPSWPIPEVPQELDQYLTVKDEVIRDCVDPATAGNLADAWHSSLVSAPSSGRKLSKATKLSSITDIVGHVVNLTICLESVLNRHLFVLKECHQLMPDLYQSIDRSELTPKLLFCFKEAILDKRLHMSGLKRLASMRNRCVHYRMDTPTALQPSIKELIDIWMQLGNVFALTTGEPEQPEIQELIEIFVEKWVM